MKYTREQIEAVIDCSEEPAMIDIVRQLLEENSELGRDALRLMFATKDYDGFVIVEKDKYDFAIECMKESGREEPTEEDELNGVRRLIDAARKEHP